VDSTIFIVKWKDACASAGWVEKTSAELSDCTSVGFVVAEDEHALVLTQTLSAPLHNGTITIPKNWIVSKRKITIENKQRKAKRKVATAVGSDSNKDKVQSGG
jgi:hypothetical protein